MRRVVWCALGLCVVFGLLTGMPARADASTNTPLLTPLDPGWNWLIELARRGELGLEFAAGVLSSEIRLDASEGRAAELLRTWTSEPIAPQGLGAGLRPQLTLIGSDTDPNRQLRPLHLDVRDGDAVDPAWRTRWAVVGEAQLHEYLRAGVQFTLDSRGDNDPFNRTRNFVQLDASQNFDSAWLRSEFGPAAFTLGRIPMGWGPERLGGLVLSPTAPAPDLFHARLRWGPHLLQTFAGQLSRSTIDEVATHRFLYGHRVDLFFLERRLRVALSETAVAAGASESLNLRYLNPIPLWAQVQVELDGDSGTQVNVIDMVDGELLLDLGSWTSRWYGSFAVDDLQIHPDGREVTPDQLAWSAGLDLSHRHWLFGYEYRRIGTWTFLHRGEGTGHTNYDRPLGAPEGPDTDRHHLQADWRPAARARLWLEGERRRRGENRVDTEELRFGNTGQPFPRGVVEKSWIGAVGVEWAMGSNARLGTAKAALRAAFHAIENLNNQSGVDADVWEVRLVLDLRAPALQWQVND